MPALFLPEWDAFIRWHDQGVGHPLICLPGISLPASSTFFDICADPRLRERRCIMIDYLGSGLSDTGQRFDAAPQDHALAVSKVLDHLGLTSCDILGLSMGGTVGIALALSRPDLVARMMVGEGNIDPGGGKLTKMVTQDGKDVFVATGHAKLISETRAKAKGGNVRAAHLAGGWAVADPAKMYANAETLVNLPSSFRDEFFSLKLPITFAYGETTHPDVQGASGPDTPDPAELHANGIATVTIPNAGHGMETDNPVGVVDAVLKAFPLSK